MGFVSYPPKTEKCPELLIAVNPQTLGAGMAFQIRPKMITFPRFGSTELLQLHDVFEVKYPKIFDHADIFLEFILAFGRPP